MGPFWPPTAGFRCCIFRVICWCNDVFGAICRAATDIAAAPRWCSPAVPTPPRVLPAVRPRSFLVRPPLDLLALRCAATPRDSPEHELSKEQQHKNARPAPLNDNTPKNRIGIMVRIIYIPLFRPFFALCVEISLRGAGWEFRH